MQRCALNLIVVILGVMFLHGCGTAGSDSTTDYDITISAAGVFPPIGAGPEQSESGGRLFGPAVGYPEPQAVEVFDAVVLERGSFLIFETAQGDLTEVTATIASDADDTVDAPDIDPDSGASRVGVAIPFLLDEGAYALELRVPTGALIARATFRVEGPPPTILGVRFEPAQPVAGEPYRIIFEFTPPGASIAYVLSGEDGFSFFQILFCVPAGALCTEIKSDLLPGGAAGVTDLIFPSIEIDNQQITTGDPISITFD